MPRRHGGATPVEVEGQGPDRGGGTPAVRPGPVQGGRRPGPTCCARKRAPRQRPKGPSPQAGRPFHCTVRTHRDRSDRLSDKHRCELQCTTRPAARHSSARRWAHRPITRFRAPDPGTRARRARRPHVHRERRPRTVGTPTRAGASRDRPDARAGVAWPAPNSVTTALRNCCAATGSTTPCVARVAGSGGCLVIGSDPQSAVTCAPGDWSARCWAVDGRPSGNSSRTAGAPPASLGHPRRPSAAPCPTAPAAWSIPRPRSPLHSRRSGNWAAPAAPPCWPATSTRAVPKATPCHDLPSCRPPSAHQTLFWLPPKLAPAARPFEGSSARFAAWRCVAVSHRLDLQHGRGSRIVPWSRSRSRQPGSR